MEQSVIDAIDAAVKYAVASVNDAFENEDTIPCASDAYEFVLENWENGSPDLLPSDMPYEFESAYNRLINQ